MKKILLLHLIFFVFPAAVMAQVSLPDSLKRIAEKAEADSAAKLYAKIANIFTGVNSDSVRKYARAAQKLADRGSITQGDVLIQIGNSYHMENNIDSALYYYNLALQHYKRINNEKGIGKVYQSFAIVKKTVGDLNGAIEDNKKALAIYLKLNWEVGIINTYNNISATYSRLQRHDEALKFARGAFSRSKSLNDSLKYYNMMSEYGGKLAYAGRVDSAIHYLSKAAPYLERNNMFNLLIPAYSNLAGLLIFAPVPDVRRAREALMKAKEYSIRSGAHDNLRHVYRDFSNLYLREGKIDSASMYFDKTINFIDSLTAQNAVELSKEIETKYESEKKELLLQKQAIELEAREKDTRTKNIQLIAGAIALLIIAIIAALAFFNFLKVKKFNRIINEKKSEVERQKEEISTQKEVIESKQKEIIDSINYAKRIQQAVLTGNDVWKRISPEHFILFRPKDIVSGDFYWAYVSPENIAVFALADCTGHGVPGGFMSMLGNSFLNDIVVENKIYKADEILNRLRRKIISALEQEGGTERKDGMDISLCVYHKNNSTIEFAGANNPLLVSGKSGLTEIKGDKMPVGVFAGEMRPFRSETITADRGDIVYLLTDGFSDQFGGPKEKKFTFKKLRQILSEIRDDGMSVQKEKLEKEITGWQGDFEQVDDISIIGIKIV